MKYSLCFVFLTLLMIITGFAVALDMGKAQATFAVH